MKILAIDTSSKYLSIALSDNGILMREESRLLERRHSSLLVPVVKDMLEKEKTPIKKIEAFIIGLGPGSFTGLRIGVSAIKGFGIATDKPCIGVASIDAIAQNLNFIQPTQLGKVKDRMIVPIIDAKRGNVYSAIYIKKGKRFIRKTEYLLLPIEKLMRQVSEESVFLGDGIDLYKEKINKQAVFLEERYWYPKAGNLIKLGLTKLKRTKKQDLTKLKPLYLYKKDCQVKTL